MHIRIGRAVPTPPQAKGVVSWSLILAELRASWPCILELDNTKFNRQLAESVSQHQSNFKYVEEDDNQWPWFGVREEAISKVGGGTRNVRIGDCVSRTDFNYKFITQKFFARRKISSGCLMILRWHMKRLGQAHMALGIRTTAGTRVVDSNGIVDYHHDYMEGVPLDCKPAGKKSWHAIRTD